MCKTAVCGRVYKTEVCDTVQCNLLKRLNETVDEARFFRKTENCWNKMATKISAKHQWRCQVLWQHGKSIEKKKKQIYDLQVSQYSSVVPDIAKSDLMDGKCYR